MNQIQSQQMLLHIIEHEAEEDIDNDQKMADRETKLAAEEVDRSDRSESEEADRNIYSTTAGIETNSDIDQRILETLPQRERNLFEKRYRYKHKWRYESIKHMWKGFMRGTPHSLDTIRATCCIYKPNTWKEIKQSGHK